MQAYGAHHVRAFFSHLLILVVAGLSCPDIRAVRGSGMPAESRLRSLSLLSEDGHMAFAVTRAIFVARTSNSRGMWIMCASQQSTGYRP